MSKPVVAGPRSAASGAGPAEARPGGSRWAGWRPAWSAPAARAGRATIVVPGLFALTLKVIADPQMALFAVFGGFATLVMTSFGGTRRDKAVAHLGLATAGSIALVIGTAVSGTPWLAAIVTIPVTFAIFFAGVAGPNAASGVTAALLAYVLPVASAGGVATIGSRLEGWWLASAAATAAVLLLSPRSAGDRLRTAARATAAAVGATLLAVAATGGGPAAQDARDAAASAKYDLLAAFAAAPYRPTGLAVADQALASVVQVLEWCASLASDLVDCRPDIRHAAPADRELLVTTVGLLRDCASLLAGQHAVPDLHSLESARAASAAHQREPCHGGPDAASGCTRVSFYAQVISVAARSATADTLIATRRASPELVAAQRRTWYGPPARDGAGSRRCPAGLPSSAGTRACARHGSGTLPGALSPWPLPWPSRTCSTSSTGSGWCWARCRCCARARHRLVRVPGVRWPAPSPGSRSAPRWCSASARDRRRCGQRCRWRSSSRRTRRASRPSPSARPPSPSPSSCCSTCWCRSAGRWDC